MYCTYLWPAGGQRFTASCTHLQTAVRSQWAAAVADSCRPSWITQTSQTSRQRRRFGVETHQCRCRKGRIPKGWLNHEFPVPKNRWSPCWQAHCEGIYMMFRCYDLRVFCVCMHTQMQTSDQHDSDMFGMMPWVAEPLLSRSLCSVWIFFRKHFGKPGYLGSMFFTPLGPTRGFTKHPWHAIFWRESNIMSGTNGYRDARNARNSWRCLGTKGRRRSLSRCPTALTAHLDFNGLIQRFHSKCAMKFLPSNYWRSFLYFFILFKWRNCSAALRIIRIISQRIFEWL